MPEFGFPAQPRHALLARLTADLRERGDAARAAAVTGRFADVTKQRGGRVNELMQIEKSIGDLASYAEAIALSEARAATMQTSLATLGQIGQGLADTTAVLMTSGTDAQFAALSDRARGELDAAISALNSHFGGRALFAGDNAAGAALADAATILATSVPFLEAAASAPAGYTALQAEFFGRGATFETAFYLGGAGAAPLTEVGPGERVDYSARADESAVRAAIFNAVVLAAAYDTTNAIPAGDRRTLLGLAADGMRSAISELAGVQARLGNAEARIHNVKARNIATQAALTLRFNDLASADQYEAAVTLTELDRQLETAYATTARLSRLTLTNYL